MGATIEAGGQAECRFAVRGRDDLDVVEVIQDRCVVHRAYAEDGRRRARFAAPTQLRLEWLGTLGCARTRSRLRLGDRAQVRARPYRALLPCLQSMPFDEQRRHRFHRRGEAGLAIRSYTARQNAYRGNPNQSVVLEIEGGPDTALELALTEPVAQRSTHTLAELRRGSANLFTGPFPKEGYQWHRLVPRAASSLEGRCTLELPRGRSHAYLRARQRNGHVAWASPVFLNWR